MSVAHRLVQDLMLVSVCVAGEGAAPFGDALAQAGAAVELLTETDPGTGYDMAVLLGAPDGAAALAATAARLANTSNRLLFVPLPLDQPGPLDEPTMAALTEWFELFAEHGYQPVVDFDAGYLSAGAFLVDREAVAAEAELAAFTDRLQFGEAPEVAQVRALEQAGQAASAERDALQTSLAQAQAQAETLRTQLTETEAQLQALIAHAQSLAASEDAARTQLAAITADNAGWDGLRAWVRAEATAPGRDTLAALARDWPALMALRGPEAPLLHLPTDPVVPPARRSLFGALFSKPPAPPAPKPPALLLECAQIRASQHFDAAWYIASNPECAGLDPVFHYRLVGAPSAADPGPWFDTAAYLSTHPEAADCPLLHFLNNPA